MDNNAVLCNFCQRRETRSRPFKLPFTCVECENNEMNYINDRSVNKINNDDIIFVDAQKKHICINKDTDLRIDIENPIPHNEFYSDNSFDRNNFKDALLANLYSQVEFLKQQIGEKDLLIRTLIIKESDVYNQGSYVSSYVGHENTEDGQDDVGQINNKPKAPSSKGIEETASLNSSEAPASKHSSVEINNDNDDEDDDEDENGENFFQDICENFEEKKEKLEQQLKEVREQNRKSFKQIRDKEEYDINKNKNKFDTNYHNNEREKTNPDEIWGPETILIVGDSMINQMDEKRLSFSTTKDVKVRAFGGVDINGMYQKLDPLVKKKPGKIILHVGTQDTVHKNSKTILNDLFKLKQHIEAQLPGVMVVLSCPITRVDNSKSRLTITHLIESVKPLKVNYLLNVNIGENCLGRKGLHLNPKGVGRFATNLISLIRKL